MTSDELARGVDPMSTTSALLMDRAYEPLAQFCNAASARDTVRQIIAQASAEARH